MERDKFMQIRVSEKERSEYKTMAKASGITVSDLVREAMGRVQVWTPVHRDAQREKILQLARVGNNLNQVARWCNTHKSGADAFQICRHLVSIERELNKAFD